MYIDHVTLHYSNSFEILNKKGCMHSVSLQIKGVKLGRTVPLELDILQQYLFEDKVQL